MAKFWIIGALNWIPKWFLPYDAVTPHRMAEMFSDFVINGVAAQTLPR
jgi:hypothetical protein